MFVSTAFMSAKALLSFDIVSAIANGVSRDRNHSDKEEIWSREQRMLMSRIATRGGLAPRHVGSRPGGLSERTRAFEINADVHGAGYRKLTLGSMTCCWLSTLSNVVLYSLSARTDLYELRKSIVKVNER